MNRPSTIRTYKEALLQPTVRLYPVGALLTFLFLGILALGLRLHGIERHTLWLDEAYAVQVARQSPGAIIQSLAHDNGAPLYYGLLHGWMLAFGESELAVRMLSVLCGLLLVPAASRLAWRLGGRRAGWMAAALMSTLPIAVQFSQEARMYMLLPLLAVLSAEQLLAYLESGRRGPLITHALLMAAVFYCHNWGLLLLPASALAVVAYPKSLWRGWSVAALSSLLLYSPWLPVLASQTASTSYRFIETVQSIPSWQLPFHSLMLFASGVGTTGGEARSLLPAGGGMLAALVWALMIFAVGKEKARAPCAVLVMALTPLFLALLPGLWGRAIYLLGRYEILVLPLFVALVAGGASRILRGKLLPLVATGWVALLVVGSKNYTSEIQRRFPEEAMAGSLAAQLQPGDRVVFAGLHRAAMEYYLRRAGAKPPISSFPAEAARHLGWFDKKRYDPIDPALKEEAHQHCPGERGRTWIVATGSPTSQLLLGELSSCARIASPFSHLGSPHHYMLVAHPFEGQRAAAFPFSRPGIR